jgi:hypothetical protein
MKARFCVWAIGVLFSLSSPFSCVAQSYHKLIASDFAGTPPPDNGFAAYTYCDINYSYNTVRHNGNYDINFNVQVLFNSNRSWIRYNRVTDQTMLQNILRHEQGHYNMAYLMKNELYSVFTHHRYTANYQAEIVELFKQVESKYHKLNDDYEDQTQHMNDIKNQDKWNAWFDKQLSNTEMADANGTNRWQ